MDAERWYWCFTHDRVESHDQRDDPDNALGPYPSAAAAADWRSRAEQRDEAWVADDKAWEGEEEPEG
jgi:hypothetical protein